MSYMVLSNLFFLHYDKPDCVHEFLKILLGKKLRYIDESLKAASIDLVETGGEAASNNIISLQIHEEFCLPYDQKMYDAIHNVGHKISYLWGHDEDFRSHSPKSFSLRFLKKI